MSTERRTEGVIGASDTIALIDYIQDEVDKLTIDLLVENVVALFGGSRTKVRNTISLLTEVGVLQIRDEFVQSSTTVSGVGALGTRLVDFVLKQDNSIRLGNSIRLTKDPPEMWVDAKRAPGREIGIAALLVDIGVFQRERLVSPNWRIGEQFSKQFIRAIAHSNDAFVQRARTAEDLESQMNANHEAGMIAEEWVVCFEQERLSDHPLRNQIRRISDIQVDAGFDVVSFRDESSVSHNWLIEVKSFVGMPRFYWTENEVARAKREGERYVLYLVDRRRMQLEDYKPYMITGPYEHFFGTESPRGWTIDPSEFRMSFFSN